MVCSNIINRIERELSILKKLTRNDLYTLEKYEEVRTDFRSRVIPHKEIRRVKLGEEIIFLFEDRLTMQYQIQEILRAEKVFNQNGINDELNAYNPLIPEGQNWKITLMLVYEDKNERKKRLEELVGVEECLWLQVEGFEKVWSNTKEDLNQGDRGKTSSVHFLSFDLNQSMIHNLKLGSSVMVGVDHKFYKQESKISEDCRLSLIQDLD